MADGPLDCIVIGAGYAGLAAARTLAEAGLRVRVLEAAPRVGGRAHCDVLAGTRLRVDWGAEWVLPDHHHALMAEARRHGIALEEADTLAPSVWRGANASVTGDLAALLRARPGVARLFDALERQAANPAGDDDRLSWGGWLAAADREDAAFCDAAMFPLTGAHPSDVALSMILDEIRFHGGTVMETLQPARAARLAGGADSIAAAMAARLEPGVLRLGAAVAEIREDADGVTVSGGFGRLTAPAVIVALPVNVLARLDWQPALASSRSAPAVAVHAGRTVKVWALADAGRVPGERLSADGPFRLAYARPAPGGGVLLCAQALADEFPDRSQPAIAAAFQAPYPGMPVMAAGVRDWVSEPLARGSWHAGRPGQAEALRALACRSGRVRFCGGDFPGPWSGWMEGALRSGRAAALALAKG